MQPGPVVRGCPSCLSSGPVPELLLLQGFPWGRLLDLLPIVYSEGVIHKNSRTTALFLPSCTPGSDPPQPSAT